MFVNVCFQYGLNGTLDTLRVSIIVRQHCEKLPASCSLCQNMYVTFGI